MKWNERIAAARLAKGLTQTQLGERVNSTQSTIAKYETGERQPSFAKIERIAKETDTTPEWLAFGVGNAPKGVANKGQSD